MIGCYGNQSHKDRRMRMLTLDVVTKDLAVTLGASLSKSLSSLAASRHGCLL